ncbi:MAG: ATPase [Dehalococcoidia bacterium]|nr:ATPase [Dehalococcoidia bacterium]
MTDTGTLTVTTPTDLEISLTRTFDAPRQLVFDAHTQPELVKRWLTGPEGWTLDVCEIDLRQGGAFRYEWRHPDEGTMGMGGVYHEVVSPERIVHTELFDEDWTGGETVTTTVLTEVDGKTMVTATTRYVSREARDEALATGMATGMEASYDHLDDLLAEVAGG